MKLTVKLAYVEGMLGFWLALTLEERRRLTATDGTDSKGKERWAIAMGK
jgi:hypothetical protein